MVAVVLWGEYMVDRKIVFWSDKMAVVKSNNILKSCFLPVLALLIHLVLCCLQFNILVRAQHVPGVENKTADTLSNFQWNLFRELHLQVEQQGMRCPERL